MSSAGAKARTVVPVSIARAEASRKNRAQSRGPRTAAGKARSAQNALKHGMPAAKSSCCPTRMPPSSPASRRRWSPSWRRWARRPCSRAASRSPPGGWSGRTGWPPERGWGPVPQPGGQQGELFAERSWGANANSGLALIRDGNGTRSFETLLRYRGAAMAEFWRALRTLKALQAEQTESQLRVAAPAPVRAQPRVAAARSPIVRRPGPNDPERRRGSPPERRLEYLLPDRPAPGRILHEPAAPWTPDAPEPARARARPAKGA